MRAQVRADLKSNPLFLHCFFREGRDHPMTDKRLGLSEREYACRVGISRGAVQKARQSGRLVLHADGSIDASASDVRRAQATDPSKQHSHAPSPRRGYKPVPDAAVGAVAETLKEQGLMAPQASAMTFLQARTANEVLKARLRRMELQQKEGELVDRARATALVFRLARQERDVWLGWPARVAAMMAAELGLNAHALQTVLESHVREHLASLAEVRCEFR